ncbi:MAG: hypothetical protein VB859_19275 [Planctomycetaceae bacterium]
MLVAYHIYRGPGGELPDVPGLLPRCEFGLEILVTLAFEVVIVGLSMDKTIGQLGFFWNLSLGKSQVDSLLSRLARDWEPEFDALCELLAVSAVVHGAAHPARQAVQRCRAGGKDRRTGQHAV